jgi:succinate dehydrogenase / fumarate reductase cytochrome b subunit
VTTAAASTELTTTQRAGLMSGPTYFLIRRLHSLTGLVFGGYLIVHLLVNATISRGGTEYQVQVDKIHSLPFLPVIEWTFIYLPIIFHTIYGAWIIVTGQPNVNRYPYEKNIFYTLQRISAVVIVFFMLFHVLSLKYGWLGVNLSFEPQRALGTVGRHLDHGFLAWVVYPIGILASCYHLANGFWAAAITWGLTVSQRAQKRWGYVCAALFVLTLVAGMVALVAGANLDWTDLLKTQQELGHGA